MMYKIEKPDLSKISKKEFSDALTGQHKDEVMAFVKRSVDLEYLYWDKIQYKEPSPKEISKETLWQIIKWIRDSKKIKTIIKDEKGKYFSWSKLDYFEEFFHYLDMNTGGEIFVQKSGIEIANKQKLVIRGIMEEAIASSQLEGADTSRQAAKKMLREGRKPMNSSEQMIVNNYVSMKAIEEDYKEKKLSLDLIYELHALITKDVLDSQNEKPRLRKKGEIVYVTDKVENIDYHKSPDIEFVKTELEKLIQFANDELDNENFIHPVVKAIMIHYWIGYLHPFTDGNGRLARLLFYWYLLKKGYWAFVYLPVSKVIKKASKQYVMSYTYSEQDDNDMTYFIDYNLRKIRLSVKDFIEYLERQASKNTSMKKTCDTKYKLNLRQVQLLQYFYGDPNGRTSLSTHMNVNQVTKMTAIKDLKDLVNKGFLTTIKQGIYRYYYGTEKIKELF